MSTISRRMQQAHSGVLQDGEVSDVFNVTNYVGNQSTKFVGTGNVDILTHGGMVQITHALRDGMWYYYDTERGATYEIENGNDGTSSAQATSGLNYTNPAYSAPQNQNNQVTNSLTSWATGAASAGAIGFNIGNSSSINGPTNAGSNNINIYTAYSWRKAKHFFDVVKYTGNGASSRQIAHGLGSAPGMIWCKSIDTVEEFFIYHRSANGGTNPHLYGANLSKNAFATTSAWAQTAPTSSNFSVGGSFSSSVSGTTTLNNNGEEYIAYIWGHDTGIGGDHISKIQCSYWNGSNIVALSPVSGRSIDTPWRSQYLVWKNSEQDGYWFQTDKFTGMQTTRNGGNAAHVNGLWPGNPVDYVKVLHSSNGRTYNDFDNYNFLTMDGANKLKVVNSNGAGSQAYYYHAGTSNHVMLSLSVRDDEGTKSPEPKVGVAQGHVFSTTPLTSYGFGTGHRVDTQLYLYNVSEGGVTNNTPWDAPNATRTLYLQSQNMGSASTIINFKNWGATNSQTGEQFPFFISSNHGGPNYDNSSVDEFITKPGYFPTGSKRTPGENASTPNHYYGFGLWKKAFGYHSFEHFLGDNSTDRAVPTSLGVKPEMAFVKQINNHQTNSSNGFGDGYVFHKDIAYGQSYGTNDYILRLNTNDYRLRVDNFWGTTEWANWTAPTNANQYGISYMNVGLPNNGSSINSPGPGSNNQIVPINQKPQGSYAATTEPGYCMWVWATVPGLSKIGRYTGDGQSTKNIDCGFTTGARLVMIKNCSRTSPWLWIVLNRTGATGDNDKFIETSFSTNSFTTPAAAGVFVGTEGTNSSASGANKTIYVESVDIMDSISTGFQIRSSDDKINRTSDHYIFAAWA